jgi:GNAT superfamily N-acetyltransferase
MLENFIARLARILGRRVGVRLSRVVVRPLDTFAPLPPAPEIRCRRLREAEIHLWTYDAALELRAARVRAALDRGDVCVGAYDGDRLIAYEWVAFGTTPHVAGLWVEFKASDCYIYRKFVHPAYRGLGISALLDAEANLVAARHKRERVVCAIDLDNVASWKAAKRSGSSTVGYVGYIACFGFCIPFRTPRAMEQGFRFYDSGVSTRAPLPAAAR